MLYPINRQQIFKTSRSFHMSKKNTQVVSLTFCGISRYQSADLATSLPVVPLHLLCIPGEVHSQIFIEILSCILTLPILLEVCKQHGHLGALFFSNLCQVLILSVQNGLLIREVDSQHPHRRMYFTQRKSKNPPHCLTSGGDTQRAS